MGDLIVLGVIALICGIAIYSMIKNKKNSCSGVCSGCSKVCTSDIYEKYHQDNK